MASVNSLAMTDGMVAPCPKIDLVMDSTLLPITMVTAMVSPMARPRPEDGRAGDPGPGSGQHGDAGASPSGSCPSASAASFSSAGAVAKTSRQIAVTIGSTMIASTTPAAK